MGGVYLANDTSLDQQVAVKVNFRVGEDSSTQFYREARLLASLRHLHLPRVIDYFVIANNQFLVMDYIPGEDLGTLIAREGRQPVERVKAWAKQLGEALVYLHGQHPPVVHRDIKPANIKITPSGDLVLVDFGIAKATDASQSTSTGASGYTPGFAPPEQYGATRTGPYTDQFSFAATLYMLLTGERPADSIERTLNQTALIPIHDYNPKVPAEFEQAILKGMALRPDERFASMRELLNALTGEALPEHKAPLDLDKPTEEATQTAPPDALAKARPEEPPSPLEATAPAPAKARPAAATRIAARPEGAPAKTVMAQPPPAATIQVPLDQAAIPAAPAAAPKAKPRISIALIAGSAVVVLALLIGGFFIVRGMINKAASPTAAPTLPLIAELSSATPTEPAASATTAATLPPASTETPEPSSTPEPSATPTATQMPIGGGGVVAFSSDRGGDGTLQIWTMNVYLDNTGQTYSSEPVQLTFDAGHKTQPAWSPDGKKLAYVAPGGSNLGLDIWVVNADGSEPLNITNKKGDDTDPAWSPDGKLIAFTNNGRSDGIRQVYTVAPDGKDLKRISFDQEEFMPFFSPDGKNLAFVMYVASHEVLYLRGSSTEFEEFSRFDNVELLGRLGYVEHPSYSPDGNWIAYTRTESYQSSRQQIYSVRTASRGGDVARLTEDNASREPAWSPDSRWIVFTSNRDGNPEVYIMSNNGQFQVNLTNSPGVDMQPDWQPLPSP